MQYLCAVCGKRISPRFWVCSACRKDHGLDMPYAQWPAWAKAVKEDEQSRRRDEERYREHEEQEEDIDDVWDLLAPNEGDQWHAWAVRPEPEPATHLRTRLDLDEDTHLPTGPYPTEELNRAYRAANGIAERA